MGVEVDAGAQVLPLRGLRVLGAESGLPRFEVIVSGSVSPRCVNGASPLYASGFGAMLAIILVSSGTIRERYAAAVPSGRVKARIPVS
ncbi:hypothetical protein L1856_01670 [Streptomyces sp. Tue 6430]|nr:hypothetical protein [Streptomyces sp. Tue 6430]